jgi:hypothetical protein
MANLPFSDGLSPQQYTHRLLLAILRRGPIKLSQDDIRAVTDQDSLIVVNENLSREIVLRCGPRNTEVVFIDSPKDEKSWTNKSPQTEPQNPQTPLLSPANSIPSSQRTEEYHFNPLPQVPVTEIPRKTKLNPLGVPESPEIPDPMENLHEEDNEDELEMEEMEEVDPEIYQEPNPPLPTSPIEEIAQALNQPDPTDQPQRSPSSRRAVLDDMSLFLKETAMNKKIDQRREATERILRNRDGLLPFKARKDNPNNLKGHRNRL